jgi:hypothetical protein
LHSIECLTQCCQFLTAMVVNPMKLLLQLPNILDFDFEAYPVGCQCIRSIHEYSRIVLPSLSFSAVRASELTTLCHNPLVGALGFHFHRLEMQTRGQIPQHHRIGHNRWWHIHPRLTAGRVFGEPM